MRFDIKKLVNLFEPNDNNYSVFTCIKLPQFIHIYAKYVHFYKPIEIALSSCHIE